MGRVATAGRAFSDEHPFAAATAGRTFGSDGLVDPFPPTKVPSREGL